MGWIFWIAASGLVVAATWFAFPFAVTWTRRVRCYESLEAAKKSAETRANQLETEQSDSKERIAKLEKEASSAVDRIANLQIIAESVASWQERAKTNFELGYKRAVAEVVASQFGGTFTVSSIISSAGRLLISAVADEAVGLAPRGALFRVVHTDSETTAMWLRCEGSTPSGKATLFVPETYGDLTESDLNSYAAPGVEWPAEYAIVAPNSNEILNMEWKNA